MTSLLSRARRAGTRAHEHARTGRRAPLDRRDRAQRSALRRAVPTRQRSSTKSLLTCADSARDLGLTLADDLAAYDLRPEAVARAGARILARTVAALTMQPLAAGQTRRAACRRVAARRSSDRRLIDAALILCADHELNVSSFTARVVASADATPYAVVIAGLAALGGFKHGGSTGRVEALLREIGTPERIAQVTTERLRRGERIPGFGHALYPNGDPRAARCWR